MTSERETVAVEVEVRIETRQGRERRERAEAQPRQIEQGQLVDWRSYDSQAVPNRWRCG